MKELNEVPLKSSLKREHNSQNSIPESFRRRRSVHFSTEIDIEIFDELFVQSVETVGKYSLWIILVLILTSWMTVILAIQNSLFIATQILNFTCDIPTQRESNWSFGMKRNVSSPISKEAAHHCFMYDIDYLQLSNLPYEKVVTYVEENKKNFRIQSCSRIVSDNNFLFRQFICVDGYLQSLCKKVCEEYLLISGLFGRLLIEMPMGIAADIYGRRPVIQVTTLICILGLLVVLVSQNIWSFLIGRLIIGAEDTLVFLFFSNTVVFVGWGVGYIIAALLMYNLKHLWFLHCSSVTLTLVCLFGMWYIPESPRWLITQKRYKDAWKVINEIDNTQLTDIEITELPTKRSTIKEQLQIFYLPGIRKRIIRGMLMCAANFLAYYMTQKEALKFQLNLYNYFLIFSVSSMLHPLFAVMLIKFLGKKLSITFVYTILAILYSSIIAQESRARGQTTLFVLLTNFSSLANHLTLAHTIEMFPVAFGSTILGLCTTFGTLVVILQEILDCYVEVKILNNIWFIAFIATAMIIVLLLPETYGKLLPLTLHDAKMLQDVRF